MGWFIVQRQTTPINGWVRKLILNPHDRFKYTPNQQDNKLLCVIFLYLHKDTFDIKPNDFFCTAFYHKTNITKLPENNVITSSLRYPKT